MTDTNDLTMVIQTKKQLVASLKKDVDELQIKVNNSQLRLNNFDIEIQNKKRDDDAKIAALNLSITNYKNAYESLSKSDADIVKKTKQQKDSIVKALQDMQLQSTNNFDKLRVWTSQTINDIQDEYKQKCTDLDAFVTSRENEASKLNIEPDSPDRHILNILTMVEKLRLDISYHQKYQAFVVQATKTRISDYNELNQKYDIEEAKYQDELNKAFVKTASKELIDEKLTLDSTYNELNEIVKGLRQKLIDLKQENTNLIANNSKIMVEYLKR